MDTHRSFGLLGFTMEYSELNESGFTYMDGRLHCDGFPVETVVEDFGTPCYVYSRKVFLDRLRAFRDAFRDLDALVCFSVKSLANLSMLKLVAHEGCGFDVVSGGELFRVLHACGDAARSVFAGVGKTRREIEFALRHGIHMFNVESESEMHLIQQVAHGLGAQADVAIRVNPDVDAKTHAKTTTGKKENKFGIGLRRARQLALDTRTMSAVNMRGLHMHLGSPIYEADPYVQGLQKVASLMQQLHRDGVTVDTINLGGGYCMSYTGEPVLQPSDYARVVAPLLRELRVRLILEPGRHIAAPAGVLVVRVIGRKETDEGRRFIMVDGAMNDLVRPALYGAFHRVWPVRSPDGMPDVMRPGDAGWDGFDTEEADVVGPVCESGDCLAGDRPVPPVREGELMAVFDAGAYGSTMSSNYNGRLRAAEVLVDGTGATLIARRETYRDLIAREELAVCRNNRR